MISTAILTLLYWILYVITLPIQAFPTATLPAYFSTTITTLNGYLASVWLILPQSTTALIAALGVMLTIEIGIFGYKLVMWVVKRIPTQSGGGEG